VLADSDDNPKTGSSTALTQTNSSSFGRPKGTSVSYSQDIKERLQLAKAYAAQQYSIVREEAKSNNKSAERGVLERIISTSIKKYGLSHLSNVKINAETIRTRAKRGILEPITVEQGTPSPMLSLEPYIVELIIQLSRMRSPINVTTGLQLANSLIAGTQIMHDVLQWKVKHNVHARQKWLDDFTSDGRLGKGYWRGFMRRNGHKIKCKKAVKFDNKRAEWCTYQNFKVMYDEVYKELVKAGIASMLPATEDSKHFNKKGEIVHETNDAFGLPTRYIMKRPDKLIFVDEVGSNTNTSKDGNIGGEKFLCKVNSRPQIRVATKDSHFTVLGFTTVLGVPVMCSIIFAAKELDEAWVLGFDASAEWSGNEDDMDANTGGIGKRYPMGPTCTFNNKTIPTFCCCSENGSITAELLVEMLKALDKLEVFDRSDGVPPFLLLDGHGSRFDYDFLKYINEPETKWNVCIGVPYGTSYWQVGDSNEQNGCFKMALTRHKRNLLNKKEERREEFAIHKSDIVYLVSMAWADSFARIESNRNAIADRGWSPLNYNCLCHPEILSTKTMNYDDNDEQICTRQQEQEGAHRAPEQSLNLSKGLAGSLIDSIVAARIRDDARNGVNLEENRLKRVQNALEAIGSNKRRYTAGLHVSAGRFMLSTDVLENVRERKLKQEQIQSEKHEKKKQDFKTLQDKVAAIRDLRKPYNELNVAQLKTMVSWYRRPSDQPPPTTQQLLLTRLNKTSLRQEPDDFGTRDNE
jgi:hypothetical protein